VIVTGGVTGMGVVKSADAGVTAVVTGADDEAAPCGNVRTELVAPLRCQHCRDHLIRLLA
jgi:hypothetical protein